MFLVAHLVEFIVLACRRELDTAAKEKKRQTEGEATEVAKATGMGLEPEASSLKLAHTSFQETVTAVGVVVPRPALLYVQLVCLLILP